MMTLMWRRVWGDLSWHAARSRGDQRRTGANSRVGLLGTHVGSRANGCGERVHTDGRRSATERGMVTVEMAFGLLGAAVALVMAVGVFSVVAMQTMCQSVAMEVAREASRGDLEAVDEIVSGATSMQVTITADQESVRVDVTRTMRPWGSLFPGVTLHGQAISRVQT